jgi:hypothetical protein
MEGKLNESSHWVSGLKARTQKRLPLSEQPLWLVVTIYAHLHRVPSASR